MNKRLAFTKDGKLTYCTASEENIGKGRCNHVAHQQIGETTKDFIIHVNEELLLKNARENYKQELYNLSAKEKNKMIKNHENLDIFVNDKSWRIRKAVAKQRYGLDKLVNDSNEDVRIEVAKQGYGLDKLVNDENWLVRIEVARQGYGLDKLMNDNWYARIEVAKQGYGLDKLINDKYWEVRAVVAEQGYGLDKLVNDEDEYVLKSARSWLEKHNLTLEQWKEKYPDKVVKE